MPNEETPLPIGSKFNRLTTISEATRFQMKSGKFKFKYECVCKCGNKVNVIKGDLISGNTKSCGCIQGERRKAKVIKPKVITHGLSQTKLYNVWHGMTQRCCDENHRSFENYGGRGITICEEWLAVTPFYEWALNTGYQEGLTIDRIDTNGNYCPENCRWVDNFTQQNNRRNNHRVIAFGESKTITEWSRDARCVVPRKQLWQRIYRGTDPEKAITIIHLKT